MPKTENITQYACDRCGTKAYLRADDPKTSDWHAVKRVTADGADANRLLCAACFRDWRTLAVRQDNDFNQWMLNVPTPDSGKEES